MKNQTLIENWHKLRKPPEKLQHDDKRPAPAILGAAVLSGIVLVAMLKHK